MKQITQAAISTQGTPPNHQTEMHAVSQAQESGTNTAQTETHKPDINTKAPKPDSMPPLHDLQAQTSGEHTEVANTGQKQEPDNRQAQSSDNKMAEPPDEHGEDGHEHRTMNGQDIAINTATYLPNEATSGPSEGRVQTTTAAAPLREEVSTTDSPDDKQLPDKTPLLQLPDPDEIHKCNLCNNIITHLPIECDSCRQTVHYQCEGLSEDDAKRVEESNCEYVCKSCSFQIEIHQTTPTNENKGQKKTSKPQKKLVEKPNKRAMKKKEENEIVEQNILLKDLANSLQLRVDDLETENRLLKMKLLAMNDINRDQNQRRSMQRSSSNSSRQSGHRERRSRSSSHHRRRRSRSSSHHRRRRSRSPFNHRRRRSRSSSCGRRRRSRSSPHRRRQRSRSSSHHRRRRSRSSSHHRRRRSRSSSPHRRRRSRSPSHYRRRRDRSPWPPQMIDHSHLYLQRETNHLLKATMAMMAFNTNAMLAEMNHHRMNWHRYPGPRPHRGPNSHYHKQHRWEDNRAYSTTSNPPTRQVEIHQCEKLAENRSPDMPDAPDPSIPNIPKQNTDEESYEESYEMPQLPPQDAITRKEADEMVKQKPTDVPKNDDQTPPPNHQKPSSKDHNSTQKPFLDQTKENTRPPEMTQL